MSTKYKLLFETAFPVGHFNICILFTMKNKRNSTHQKLKYESVLSDISNMHDKYAVLLPIQTTSSMEIVIGSL